MAGDRAQPPPRSHRSASERVQLSLAKELRRSIRAGHPWLYDRALRPGQALQPGQLVGIRDKAGPMAVGFADPTSPIRVRLLDLDPDAELDATWAEGRAARAGARRRADPRLAGTDALRLVHGEADSMPGLVIDLYASTAVVVLDGAGAAAFWTPRLDAVMAGLGAAGFSIEHAWLRGRPGDRSSPGRVLAGRPPDPVAVDECGARLEVDVRRGQKTGLFLDQRDNRLHVRGLSAGAQVLNLFGYTGGFSVHAGLGGARRVVTVDSARPAIDAARRNLAASGLNPAHHELHAVDAFDWLTRTAAAGRRFDLVICDPPSFAPSAETARAAHGAYRRLNAMALAVVAPGGLLLTASCSSHFTREDLAAAVAAAAWDAERHVVVRSVRGAAGDHPVLPAFPEGDYLVLLDCYVE